MIIKATRKQKAKNKNKEYKGKGKVKGCNDHFLQTCQDSHYWLSDMSRKLKELRNEAKLLSG